MSFFDAIKSLIKKLRDLPNAPNAEINDTEVDKQFNYEYSDFKNIQTINGNVARANWKNKDNFYALKFFNYDEGILYQIVNEVELHRTVGFHKNILRFYGITKMETDIVPLNKYVLVLEYTDSGTLNTYLNEHFNELDWNDKLSLALQLASAILYLHEKNIIHRDLHDNNILIHQKNIKLADFGLSREIKNSINTSYIFSIIPYLDPKSFIPGNSNYKLDERSNVYSIGMLFWQISSGFQPFRDESYNTNLALGIINGQREKNIVGTPDEYNKLYTKCWDHEPDERPDMNQVVSELNQLKSSISSGKFHEENYRNDNAAEWIKNALKNKKVNFIPVNQLKNPIPLEEGGFGSIFKATWEKTNDKVVYKKLTNTVAIKNHKLVAFINELKIHLHLDYSDRIVRCLGISQDRMTDEYLLVMQYADGGNLQNYLRNNFEYLTWNDKKKLASQIADGLKYLHNEDVLHKDLHAKNIVIHQHNAKITDFGTAKFQNQKSEAYMVNFGIVAYMEPKRFLNPKFPYTKSSDIYSFGVLMWEISSGYPPFKDSIGKNDNAVLAYAITNGTRETEIAGTPDDYKNLYKNCWNQEPEQRPTISEVSDRITSMVFEVNIQEPIEDNNLTPELNEDLFLQTSKISILQI